MKKINKNTGITLIALVVTIIVLLILAGVSISMLTGQNGILNRASEAKEKTEDVQKDEDEKMQGYESAIDKYAYGVPEGLEVGSPVTYSPSGTYNWQAKYCSTTKTDDVTLSSTDGESFNLTEWRVLSIENGKVELVPTNSTSGKVYLGQAQGYNNGVKLLNDACNSLYSNTSKGITARSLNIEDIEKYMDKTKLLETHKYQYTSGGGAKYGTQLTNEYTSSKNYPSMYAKEILSVINGGDTKENGLGMSKQTDFIEKNDDEAADGKITTAQSIHPYQTYWYRDNSYMQTAFIMSKDGINYYNLLMPQDASTNYWLASRCIGTYSTYCYFDMCLVNDGNVDAYGMYYSSDETGNGNRALFPVVSLNASLISGDSTNGFTVNMN